MNASRNHEIVEVSLESFSRTEDLGRYWTDLERRSNHSLFQSWGWVGTWLRALPEGLEARIAVARVEGEVWGLAVLYQRTSTRYGFLNSHGLFLNETGDPALDCLTVEYNGFLADVRAPRMIIQATIRHLVGAQRGWDELFLSGVDASYKSFAEDSGLTIHLRGLSPCDYVDFCKVRESGGDYLATLSSNTRSQLRRTMRRYEKIGEVTCHMAVTLEQALEQFNKLKGLHQKYWKSRGQPGAFANPMFEKFHTALIVDRFSEGEIQLVSLRAGQTEIGYLYNLHKNGHVYAYQRGFNYSLDRKLKPGLLSHYLALEQQMKQGATMYDFMAGEGQHKRSLSTDRRQLLWLTARRKCFKFALEDVARNLKRKMSGDKDEVISENQTGC
jgi:CelD/BcsL family acetyltransferase involved in cellulose biosynthesis